jgi:hypothetical protein
VAGRIKSFEEIPMTSNGVEPATSQLVESTNME